MTELDEENHRYIACSRRSVIVGSGAEYKGARKNKSEGGGGGEVREGTPAPLSPVPLYFSSLSLLRTALHYLNAWNRLIAIWLPISIVQTLHPKGALSHNSPVQSS